MREPKWSFPDSLQPAATDVGFDLARALDAVVLLRSEIPADGFTAGMLGTERGGYGVVIREDGLVLTIGYLITEAQTIWLTSNRGALIGGYPLAYDQASGFGLVQPLGKLDATMLVRGSSATAQPGDEAYVIGHGGINHALKTRITAKREFAGYWEYVLDEALFTSPAHPQWGGAALVDREGKLIGLGSLLVQEQRGEETVNANMFVPIDLLEPILHSMLTTGRPPHAPRPWLGMYTQESEGQLIVGGLAPGGPAERAGVQVGDRVRGVGAERAADLAGLFRMVWRQGDAGVEVPLVVARKGDVLRITARSADRNDLLKKPNLH